MSQIRFDTDNIDLVCYAEQVWDHTIAAIESRSWLELGHLLEETDDWSPGRWFLIQYLPRWALTIALASKDVVELRLTLQRKSSGLLRRPLKQFLTDELFDIVPW